MDASNPSIKRRPEIDPDFINCYATFLLDAQTRCDIVYNLYALMIKEDSLRYVFWYRAEGLPNLFEFAQYFYDPTRYLMIVTPNTDRIAGAVWIENLKGNHSAQLGLWFSRRYWGWDTLNMVEKVLQLIWDTVQIDYLFCYSPHKTVARLADRLGVPCAAQIPRMVPGDSEKLTSVYVLERGG